MRRGGRLHLVPPLFLLAAAALGLLFPGLDERFRAAPFLLSAFFLGLPHGAADFSLLLRRQAPGRFLASFALYTAGIALTLTLLVLAPLFGLVAFAVFSAWHFGSSDDRDLHKLFPTTNKAGSRFLPATARGTLILALPLAIHPSGVLSLANEWLALLRAPALSPATAAWLPNVAWGIVSIAGIALAADAITAWSRHETRRCAAGLFEILSLAAAFAILDPVFAVGCYFLLWHSLRHSLQLAEHWRHGPEESLPRRLLRVHLYSLPLLVPSLAVLAIIAFAIIPDWNTETLVALLLVFFAAVTPSHDYLIHRIFVRKPVKAGAEKLNNAVSTAQARHRRLRRTVARSREC